MRIKQTSKPNVCNQKGFTLIEAMVAFMIFVVGILGAYKLQIHATQGNTLANHVSTATTWATYAIEEVLGRDYEDIKDSQDAGEAFHGVDGLECTGPDADGNPCDADGIISVQKNGSIIKSEDPGVDPGGGLYTVYWNVAMGPDDTVSSDVLDNVKKIRVHVVRNGGVGSGLLYSHSYFKADESIAE